MTSMDDAGALMTAGRFASSTLLSAKALRIYAERGLLPPRWVDPVNGYRHYAADQVPTGWLIGLGLGVLAHMLFWHPLSILNLIGIVAALIYVLDVRPNLLSITGRR